MRTILFTLMSLCFLTAASIAAAQQLPPIFGKPVQAPQSCMPYDEFVETANKEMGQYKVGMGITADKKSIVEFYVNPEDNSWVFALIEPNILNGKMIGKIACVGPFGEMWMQMEAETKKGQMVYKK